MKRALADICVFVLLFGLLQVLPVNASILFGLAIPLFAGFARGFLEQQFLPKIAYWVAVLECGLVVFASDVILCALSSKGKAPDNFLTIFGAFFIIFIVPSVVLSIGGFIAAVAWESYKRSNK